MASARTEILHVRLAPEERARLRDASAEEYLDQSAWARRAILKALDEWSARREGPNRAAARRENA